MTSYHVSMLCNASIGIVNPNNGAQFNKCTLKRCAKYTLIKLPQYLQGIQYVNSCPIQSNSMISYLSVVVSPGCCIGSMCPSLTCRPMLSRGTVILSMAPREAWRSPVRKSYQTSGGKYASITSVS